MKCSKGKERKGKESEKKVEEQIMAETEVSADTDFEVVWDLYGKKIKKPRAEAKWKRMTKKERQLAMDHIPRFVQATPEVQFRPHFDVYLNQKRWEDEHLPGEGKRVNAQKMRFYTEQGSLILIENLKAYVQSGKQVYHVVGDELEPFENIEQYMNQNRIS